MNAPLASPPLGPRLGFCRWCGCEVHHESFDSPASVREYAISSLCQPCQNETFLGGSDLDPPISGPVRSGAVLAVVVEGAGPREAAVLPFQFTARLGRIQWEPRHVVWAGLGPPLADPRVALGAIRGAWDGRYERVLSLGSFDDPLLEARLSGYALVVTLDLETVLYLHALCPSVVAPPSVAISAVLPWRPEFDACVVECGFDPEVGREGVRRVAALRQAAFVARLLGLRAGAGRDAGRTVFELLLVGQGDRFEVPYRAEGSDDAV